jgi:NADPH-dependent 2,4-dienoyl-CoA reductase/sulfur reductase-like enzyme
MVRGAAVTSRRHFLAASAALALAQAGRARAAAPSRGRVVVVGGGYGGATAARCLRLWSGGTLGVTLVERDRRFVSCPMSNLVIGGSLAMADITNGFDALAAAGVRVVHASARGVDPVARRVTLDDGTALAYDRLVLSPGIDFQFDAIPAFADARVRDAFPHAWRAGPQTLALREALVSMRAGGVFAIAIPLAPFRCPPAPYERACQAAAWLKKANPRAKVLILDANDDVLSKKDLFKAAWATLYPGMVEYRPSNALTDVDPATHAAKLEFADDVKADVLNVIPPQKAGAIADAAGVVTANGRWCEVDFLTFESIRVKGVHVLGDAIQTAPLMPKSAHMANQQAKVCAAAIVALTAGDPVDSAPVAANTCYSFMSDTLAAHVTSVHRYDAQQKTFLPVESAGGVSTASNTLEATYGRAWARNIRADSFGA